MSKNSKYSNLPNIALDQTDVYETSGERDTTADQQNVDKRLSNLNSSKFIKQEFNQSLLEQVDVSNDNIETINIKAKDAFSKFKGKRVLMIQITFDNSSYYQFILFTIHLILDSSIR